MLCALISDTHTKHREIKKMPDAHIVIHAGDISYLGRENEVLDFFEWFSNLSYKHRILCAGNHDINFERYPALSKEWLSKYPNITYLEDSSVIIDGIKIYGSPVTPTFGYGWAFNRNRGEDIKRYWDAIDDDVDVLVTHGPPRVGTLDLLPSGELVGCTDLLNRITDLKKLKLTVHGHIHNGYGTFETATGLIISNASVLNDDYVMQNLPMLFEINKEKAIRLQ